MNMAMPRPEQRNGAAATPCRQLIVVKGCQSDSGRSFPLPEQGAFVIGRSQSSGTRLLDPKVSRAHCQIDVDAGRVMLREAPGATGKQLPVVLVNDLPATERQLFNGDVIRVGDTELRFDDGSDPYEASTVGGAIIQAILQEDSPAAAKLAELLDKSRGQKPAAAAAPRTPTPYELLEEIGRGENGVVHRAHDLALKCNVAVKELHEAVRRDAQQARPIFEEAQFLASLDDAHLVKVHGLDRDRGWIVMELMHSSIARQLPQAAVPAALVRSVLRQALTGLAVLHRQHKLHGAVKPTNLLVDAQGKVKLGDAAGLSLDGEVQKPRGNMKYVAPEMLSPEFGPIGVGVDLYCLGFTALEMLAGPAFARLFKGVGEDAIDPELGWLRLHGTRSEAMPRAVEVVPDLPADLARVVDRLLQRDVSQRYASAADAARDLDEQPLAMFVEPARTTPAAAAGGAGDGDPKPSWLSRPLVAMPLLAVLSFLFFTVAMWQPHKSGEALGGAGATMPRYAVLIGVDDYGRELPRFRHAEADMLELARVLTAKGYQPDKVRTLTQNQGALDPSKHMPTADNIRQALRSFLDRRRPDEGLLLALAGHVVQFRDESECYFCPADARLNDRKTLIPLSELYQTFASAPSECNLVLIDGCRHVGPGDNAAPPPPVQLVTPNLQAVAPPKDAPVLYSCGAGKKSYVHLDARNGVFFHYVIKAVQGYGNLAQQASVDRLEQYVTSEVHNYAAKNYGQPQRPELVGKASAKTTVASFDANFLLCLDGFRHANRRRYAEAAYYCDVVLREQEYVEAYIVRAASKLHEGKPKEGLGDLTRAIELAPTNANAFACRAEVHLALGDAVQAQVDVARAIRLDPMYGPFYATRGRIALAQKDKPAALADFDRALELNPKRAALHNARGQAYLALGELGRAQEDFATAAQLNPADPLTWLNRAALAEAEQNPVLAVEELTRALAIDPEYVPALKQRARGYERLAEQTADAEAKKSYRQKAAQDRETLRTVNGGVVATVE